MRQVKKDIKSICSFLLLLMIPLILFKNYETVRSNFTETLNLCFTGILPPLFPMLILSALVIKTGLPCPIKILLKPIEYLFGISSDLSTSVFMGMIGGYPVGIKSICTAEKLLHTPDEKITALCSVNPGPAYTILCVGISLFNNKSAGYLLYFSITASNLILFFVLKKRYRIQKNYAFCPIERKGFFDALPEAVELSVKNAVNMTAWILLFGFLQIGIQTIHLNGKAEIINCFLEITNAVRYAKDNYDLSLCSFALGFGGICLYAQLMKDLKRLNIKGCEFIGVRLLCGIISWMITKLLTWIFPETTTAAAGALQKHVVFSCGIKESAVLFIFCAFFMISSVKQSRKVDV